MPARQENGLTCFRLRKDRKYSQFWALTIAEAEINSNSALRGNGWRVAGLRHGRLVTRHSPAVSQVKAEVRIRKSE